MNAGVRHPLCVVCGLWPKPTLDSGHLVSHPSAYTDNHLKEKRRVCRFLSTFVIHLLFVVTFSYANISYDILSRYDTL